MTMIKAVVRQGRLETVEPIDLPDGTELQIPLFNGITHDEVAGDEESDRSPTSDEIAATLAAMDRLEPFDWSAEERAAWETERRARKEWEKGNFAEHAEKLRRAWE